MNEAPTVRRVVLTSSVAAMSHSPLLKPPGYVYTEADWNTESSLNDQTYSFSKAEVNRAVCLGGGPALHLALLTAPAGAPPWLGALQAERKAWEIAKQQKRWDLVSRWPQRLEAQISCLMKL